MEYTNLGSSGLKISKIIPGAMSYGSPSWQSRILDEEASLPLLKHAYDLDVYSFGHSETLISRAIETYKIPRSKLVILSKCYFGVDPSSTGSWNAAKFGTNDGEMVNQVGLSRKHIFDAVEASVKRLGTYIDVLQIHRLDRETPGREIMRALNDVVEKGWVRYLGASSMAAWEFQSLQNIAEKYGYHQFISMQPYHNLLYREEEREMFPYCSSTGVGVIPWSPLARGVLARPWDDRTSVRESSDSYLKAMIRDRETELDKEIVRRVEEVAKRKGVSMAQVAMAWVLQTKGVSGAIVGLGSRERIKEAVEAVEIRLTEEEKEELESGYMPKAVTGY